MELVRRTLQIDPIYHKQIKILSVNENKDIYKLFNEAINLFLDKLTSSDEDFIIASTKVRVQSTITTKFSNSDYKRLSLAAIKFNLKKYQILNILSLKLLHYYDVDSLEEVL